MPDFAALRPLAGGAAPGRCVSMFAKAPSARGPGSPAGAGVRVACGARRIAVDRLEGYSSNARVDAPGQSVAQRTMIRFAGRQAGRRRQCKVIHDASAIVRSRAAGA